MLTRQSEQDLIQHCALVAQHVAVVESENEAAICRLVAQLVRTRFPSAAQSLNEASIHYYATHDSAQKKTYPEIVQAGLVSDLPRLRGLMERKLKGHDSW